MQLRNHPLWARLSGRPAKDDPDEHDDDDDEVELSESAPPSRSEWWRDASVWAVVAVFTLAVLRRGWMCDDAFIMMRVVDHLVEGRGFVFNDGERVLAVTDPLWTMLLTIPYSVVRNPYLVAVMAGVVVSAIGATILAFSDREKRRAGALMVLGLCFSRGFVDFSSSGLEGSLTHLLLFIFFLQHLKAVPSLGWMSLLASLCLLNRADLAPLLVPSLVWVAWRSRKQRTSLLRGLLGLVPLVCWFGFAIVYFGFPVPNTSYAKLNADIPRDELNRQGASYLVDTLVQDPFTALLVFGAVILLIRNFRSAPAARPLLLAVALEMTYLVLIGGDFMSGRFLTPTIALSAVVLVRYGGPLLPGHLTFWHFALGVVVCSFMFTFSPFRDEPHLEKHEFPVTRIVNERAWYQERLLLGLNFRPIQWKQEPWYQHGYSIRKGKQKVAVSGAIGMFSWGTGPKIHVVDSLALSDPLLARIPAPYDKDWRTGHLLRPIPEGYVESLETGKNKLKDPCLAEYFDRLNLITRGPLFTKERWKAIVQLNMPNGSTIRPCLPEKKK